MSEETGGANTTPIIIPRKDADDYIIRCAALLLPEGSYHDRETDRIRIPLEEGATSVYISLEETQKGNTKARLWVAKRPE